MSDRPSWECGCVNDHTETNSGRAWCGACSEWCYPNALCVRGEVEQSRYPVDGPRPLASKRIAPGRCLCCGHILPYGVYSGKRGVRVGVCVACRDLASANRGPCSPARGCSCYPISTKESQ